MVEKKNGDSELAGVREKSFGLLAQAKKGFELTVRDDQHKFSTLADAARICRSKGGRFRLIDMGKFSLSELEWLGEAGADIYTSDEARPKIEQLDLLRRACYRGRAMVAYFHHGHIPEERSDRANSVAFLSEVGRQGVYLHLSNREKKRDWDALVELASSCRSAGTWLVYYHHGPLDEGAGRVVRSGGWIHLSDRSLPTPGDVSSLSEMIRESSSGGAKFVLHIEEGLAIDVLKDILKAGAFVLFKTPASDFRSRFRELEKRASKKKLDFRAYYLFTTFVP
ncbi:MAG: hypothetical protein QHH14_04105 [Clostridiales bacterium]|nr:hypothetical protein [Clostridiales bacterium]